MTNKTKKEFLSEDGVNKAKCMRWIGKPALSQPEKFVEFWKNLEQGGGIEGDKIVVSEDFEEHSGIEFSLLICMAQGFIAKSGSKMALKDKIEKEMVVDD